MSLVPRTALLAQGTLIRRLLGFLSELPLGGPPVLGPPIPPGPLGGFLKVGLPDLPAGHPPHHR